MDRTHEQPGLSVLATPGPATEALHVLTLVPFYPSEENLVDGCFVAESLAELQKYNVASSVIAVAPAYHAAKHSTPSAPAEWLRYAQVPGNFGLPTAGPLLFARLLGRIRRLQQQRYVDVIHAHSALPCGHAAAMLARRLGIPFVVTIHGLDAFNACFEDGWAAAWRKKVSRQVYRQAKVVICVSDRIRQNLEDGMDQPVPSAVVYNGTDIELFSPGEPARGEGPVILVVGSLLRGKGQETVLRAMSRISGSYPSLQCRIIGEGRDGGQFQALACELGLAQRVQFLGLQSRIQVAQAMRECTLFALPSYYEGLGCVYLEAMACGKPVIGCRGQGIGEIVQHGVNGWLVGANNVEELAEGLAALLRDAELRQKLGMAARQTIVERLTFAQQAQLLRTVYEEAAR